MDNFYGITKLPHIDGVDVHAYKPFKKHKGDGLGAFSKKNQEVLLESLNKLNDPKLIVEIGVCNNRENWNRTSTFTILKNKPKDCIYVGIDINEKDVLEHELKDLVDSNTHFFQCDSKKIEDVITFISGLGFDEVGIDLLHIDGLHTIHHIPYDWRYSEYVKKSGLILLHDTNQHPGPVALLDVLDKDIFDFEKRCVGPNDNGITVFWKK